MCCHRPTDGDRCCTGMSSCRRPERPGPDRRSWIPPKRTGSADRGGSRDVLPPGRGRQLQKDWPGRTGHAVFKGPARSVLLQFAVTPYYNKLGHNDNPNIRSIVFQSPFICVHYYREIMWLLRALTLRDSGYIDNFWQTHASESTHSVHDQQQTLCPDSSFLCFSILNSMGRQYSAQCVLSFFLRGSHLKQCNWRWTYYLRNNSESTPALSEIRGHERVFPVPRHYICWRSKWHCCSNLTSTECPAKSDIDCYSVSKRLLIAIGTQAWNLQTKQTFFNL